MSVMQGKYMVCKMMQPLTINKKKVIIEGSQVCCLYIVPLALVHEQLCILNLSFIIIANQKVD